LSSYYFSSQRHAHLFPAAVLMSAVQTSLPIQQITTSIKTNVLVHLSLRVLLALALLN